MLKIHLPKLKNMLANLSNKIIKSTVYEKSKAVLSYCFHFLHKRFLWGLFKKIDEKFFKFLFVGFINTLFSYCLYAFFVLIGLKANIALFFQYILGVLWNFKTTGCIVFKNNNNLLIFKFIGSYIVTFTINSFLLYILVQIIKLNDYLAQAVLVLPIAVISFLIFKFWVFNEKAKNYHR